MSIAISEMTENLNNFDQHQILASPDHLVNRKELMEKLGLQQNNNKIKHQNSQQASANSRNNGEFQPQWTMELNQKQEDNMANYDVPKHSTTNGHLTTSPKRTPVEKRMVAATPCACDGGQALNPQAYENYDIPKHVSQVRLQIFNGFRVRLSSLIRLTF